MAMPQKLLNGLADLGMEKMQDYLDHYSDMVNKGEKSFSEALSELVSIEKENNGPLSRFRTVILKKSCRFPMQLCCSQ